jgi:5-methylcytosine-specific restriction endonuclease McrA
VKQPTRGQGLLADPAAPPERWGGRKAQAYVVLCLDTYGRVCWLCRLPGATSADHVIPRAKGGAVYDLANLAPAHKKCNESRGSRLPVGPAAIIENGMAFFSS